MRADFPVILDACVMANYAVLDLLLRLQTDPRLYNALWTEEIIAETDRTLKKLKWDSRIRESLISKLRSQFPEAWVTGYEPIISCLSNHPKDRHVLAAAIRARAEVIVTFNTKDFKKAALSQWGVEAKHPSEFLQNLYDLDRQIVETRIFEIAARRKKTAQETLALLGNFVPAFAENVAHNLGFGSFGNR